MHGSHTSSGRHAWTGLAVLRIMIVCAIYIVYTSLQKLKIKILIHLWLTTIQTHVFMCQYPFTCTCVWWCTVHTWQAAASKLVVFKKTFTLWSDEVPLGRLAISVECVNCIKRVSLISITSIFTIGTLACHWEVLWADIGLRGQDCPIIRTKKPLHHKNNNYIYEDIRHCWGQVGLYPFPTTHKLLAPSSGFIYMIVHVGIHSSLIYPPAYLHWKPGNKVIHKSLLWPYPVSFFFFFLERK